jgi:glycosyltransferase involved in cell wall biosynthesis
MKVGIVMPYYNEPALLHGAVWGILNQTYKNYHLYVIDDGSKEGQRANEVLYIPHEFKSKVTLVYKENGGVCSARNMAIELIKQDSSIDAVGYCDGDDVWSPIALEQAVKDLQNSDLVYGVAHHRFIDGSVAYPYGIPDYPVFPGVDILAKGNFIYISIVVHRKECLSVGLFDGTLNSIEDWDYWYRMAKAGYKFVKNPDMWFVRWIKPTNNNSVSSNEVYTRFFLKHNL